MLKYLKFKYTDKHIRGYLKMPKRIQNGLTALKVKSATAGMYSDGNGLTLRVADSGSRSWVQRVTIDGKQRNVGLGSFPAVGLKDARDRAIDNLRAVGEGRNPIAEKKDAKEEAKKDVPAIPTIPTFRVVAETVIDLRRPTWSSARHAKQWTESLTNHVFPALGKKPIDAITSADVLAVLTPIWTAKAETSTRVKQRMEVVFDYCIAQGLRVDNPASAISKALPRRPRLKQHHPALPYADVPAAVAAIRESSARPATRLGFEFLICTAARAGEVVGATWEEIDEDARAWAIPADRMKARRLHRVPLSDRAMAILSEARALFGGDGLIFPSNRKQGALSNESFRVLLSRLDIPAVPHGFRSSFKDWAVETGQDWALSESALAHNLGNSMQSAYARTDLFERRRGLMAEWAEYLS